MGGEKKKGWGIRGGGGGGVGRTSSKSSKNQMKNYIPYLGMWKVYGNLERLNK